MRIVRLSETECQIARLIGRQRRDISLRYQRQSRRDFTDNGLINDIESTAAEMAVAKCLNVYPEWSPTEGEVPKFDLRWQGRRIDVKSTQRPNGNLLIPKLKSHLTYFLVCGLLPEYQIIGYLQGDAVPSLGQWQDPGKKPCWVVPADKVIQI